MPQWVRPLNQSTKDAAEWHIPRVKSFATTAYCGKIIPGTIEVTTDDTAERGRRCQKCLVAGGGPMMPQKQTAPAKKATPKGSAAKKTGRKSQPKARKRR